MLVWTSILLSLSALGDDPPHSSPTSPPPIIASGFERDLGKEVSYSGLAAAFIVSASGDATRYESALASLAQAVEKQIAEKGAAETPSARAERLRHVLFGVNSLGMGGYVADADLGDLDNLYPDRIVARKRGYCLGLTLVILDLCDRLGWKAEAVSAPRHTFLRLLGEEPVNFETTLHGESKDDAWYRDRFALADLPAPLRSIPPRRLAGHLLSNVAFALLKRGDAPAARAMIERALQIDTEIVEARTNLGVCDAREERYEEALAAFDATLEHWPGDPLTRLNRVNALLPLGRRKEAITELVDLLERYPSMRFLSERAAEIRDRLEVHRDWQDRQRLTFALVENEDRRRGSAQGLDATYYRDPQLGESALRRVDRDLSFRWGWNGPGRGIPANGFSARWLGWLSVPADDSYTFYITCSDGVRVWIDGRRVVDAWTRANDNFPTGSIDLLAGKHEFRVEYFESVGEAGIKVMLTSEKEDFPFDLPALLSHPVAETDGSSR